MKDVAGSQTVSSVLCVNGVFSLTSFEAAESVFFSPKWATTIESANMRTTSVSPPLLRRNSWSARLL